MMTQTQLADGRGVFMSFGRRPVRVLEQYPDTGIQEFHSDVAV